ncbi:MAG: hypothetical protein M3N19_00215 [Candidatus Eremiobacteraeota bacterium]|nr:hypothetical protein [Candidatus Eremiobacteraeota bacterium]
MMVSPSSSRALDEIAKRQQDLRTAYTAGGGATHHDVLTTAKSMFTLDPLSAVAPADSYFVARDERGRQVYTRDGAFHLQDNMLVDRFDQPVQGYNKDSGALAPLRIDPVDVALGRTADLQVGADGSLTYGRTAIDPRTGAPEQTRVCVGRLALARFSAATQLQAVDATRSLAPPGVVPHMGVAGDGNFGAIAPHQEEGSRVDFNLGIERLQEAYLAFDALRAAHSAQGKVEKTAMDLLK